jgi:hypothetical protein
MNDLSGKLPPSINLPAAESASAQAPAAHATLEQFCKEETTKLSPSSATSQPHANNAEDAPASTLDPKRPAADRSQELVSRARTGSVLHGQQKSFPPALSKKNSGFLASLGRQRSSPDATALATLAKQSDNTTKEPEKKSKVIFSKLFSSQGRAAATKTEAKAPQRRSFMDLSEVEAPTSNTSPKTPDPENLPIEALLAHGKKLFHATETLANTCRNLKDVIDLRVPKGASVHECSILLQMDLAQFKMAFDAKKEPLPKVQNKVVPEKDIHALKNLAGLVHTDDVWKGLFTDVIQKKCDAKDGVTFLSQTVLLAMKKMNGQEDAKMIATYLMSECTTNAGIARVVQPTELKAMLTDSRIAALPELQSAIKTAANAVMLEAVRRCQSNIVFQEVREQAKVSGNPAWKSDILEWEKTAKSFGDEHHDLEGVNHIAKTAGLQLSITPKADDQNQVDLAKILHIKNEVYSVLDLN